jgi:uncharacterized protein YraI
MAVPRAIFAGALLLTLSVRAVDAEPATVGTKLNLRSGPGPAFAVMLVMQPGDRIDVQRCHRTWCRVKHGRRVGYTSRAFLRLGMEAQASAAADVTPPPPAPPRAAASVPTGPRIWRWRDPEWRNRHWRKFGWRYRHAR